MIRLSVPLTHKYGLHARPSGLLAALACKYQSSVVILWQGEENDAKSVINLLTLGMQAGSTMEFVIDGPDEQEAAQAIEKLVSENFGLPE